MRSHVVIFVLVMNFIGENGEKCVSNRRYSFYCDGLKIVPCLFKVPVHIEINCKSRPFSVLKKKHLAGCEQVNSLRIRNCLSDIEGAPFSKMSLGSTLLIENNVIKEINSGMLITKNGPTFAIYLRNNNIEDINEGSFSYVQQLERLYLSNNKLKAIKCNVFNGLPVREIALSKNMIQIIEEGAFSNMSQLEKIDLDNNQLREIKPNIFSNLPIHILNLNKNLITVIEENSFSNMPNLHTVNLNQNQLKQIKCNTINNLPLRYLFLSNNMIESIEENAFSNMLMMYELRLQNNRIKEIKQNTFRNISLCELDLSKNMIEIIDANAFSDISSAESLLGLPTTIFLGYNQLKEIKINVFNNLPMGRLVLTGNMIQSLEPNVFLNMSKLVSLTLPKNQLREISYGIFNSLPLEDLDLSNNMIEAIQENAFSPMFDLITLELSSNRIQTIQNNAFADIPQLTVLNLMDNRLEEFATRNILNNSMGRLDWLNLSHNKLTILDRFTLEGLKSLTVFHVSFNSISVIGQDTFTETPKLELLNLNGNHLTALSSDMFPENTVIEHLQIAHNRLTYLEPRFLFILRDVSTLEVGGNPWQCACFDQLMWWMATTRVEFNPCDEEYMKLGVLPYCVMENYTNWCSYNYDPYYYQEYSKAMSYYPEPSDCYHVPF